MTFWTRAKLISPILVRLLARHKRGRPMTDDEIVKAVSGLSHFEVRTLSWHTNWDGVAVDTMNLYLMACGCDFESREDMKRIEDYLGKAPSFQYLRRDPEWKERWLPMIVTWRDSVQWLLLTNPPYIPPYIRRLADRLTPLIRKQAA